jgi:hypothetical protein
MNSRCLVSALSLLALSLSCSAGAQKQEYFKDSAAMSPEVAAAAKRLQQAKIMTASSDGKFYPKQPLTRWDLAVAAYRMRVHADLFSQQARSTEISVLMSVLAPAKVIHPKEFRADLEHATEWGVMSSMIGQSGLIEGLPGLYFGRKRTATRAEFATILARLLQRKNTPVKLDIEKIRFSDVDGDEWYFGAVLTAAGTGLMQGYPDGTFRPGRTITRGEMALILAKLLPSNP